MNAIVEMPEKFSTPKQGFEQEDEELFETLTKAAQWLGKQRLSEHHRIVIAGPTNILHQFRADTAKFLRHKLPKSSHKVEIVCTEAEHIGIAISRRISGEQPTTLFQKLIRFFWKENVDDVNNVYQEKMRAELKAALDLTLRNCGTEDTAIGGIEIFVKDPLDFEIVKALVDQAIIRSGIYSKLTKKSQLKLDKTTFNITVSTFDITATDTIGWDAGGNITISLIKLANVLQVAGNSVKVQGTKALNTGGTRTAQGTPPEKFLVEVDVLTVKGYTPPVRNLVAATPISRANPDWISIFAQVGGDAGLLSNSTPLVIFPQGNSIKLSSENRESRYVAFNDQDKIPVAITTSGVVVSLPFTVFIGGMVVSQNELGDAINPVRIRFSKPEA